MENNQRMKDKTVEIATKLIAVVDAHMIRHEKLDIESLVTCLSVKFAELEMKIEDLEEKLKR